MSQVRSVSAIAHPSLALIKYWGKIPSRHKNIPATTSIGITLDELSSKVTIQEARKESEKNTMYLDGEVHSFEKVQAVQKFLSNIYIRQHARALELRPLIINAENNFPTASGLASSSSGFAALVKGLAEFYQIPLQIRTLSSIARSCSGSASRAVYGGFSIWRRGARYAEAFPCNDFWNDLRVIILSPYMEKKDHPSSSGMIATAKTSPYYRSWIRYNIKLAREAIHAFKYNNIEKLGTLTQASYTAMHATSIAANPTIRYWKSKSLDILDYVKYLRAQGFPLWETMDAGPQVKIICMAQYVDEISKEIQTAFPDIWYKLCGIGHGARII